MISSKYMDQGVVKYKNPEQKWKISNYFSPLAQLSPASTTARRSSQKSPASGTAWAEFYYTAILDPNLILVRSQNREVKKSPAVT